VVGVFNNSILYPCALDGESKLVHIKDATIPARRVGTNNYLAQRIVIV
jgi:hypothetical protein